MNIHHGGVILTITRIQNIKVAKRSYDKYIIV